jgi:hypothetical protein
VNSLTEGWSVSIITPLELIVGARDRKKVEKIDQFLGAVSIVPLTPVGMRSILQISWLARVRFPNCCSGDRGGPDVTNQKRKTFPYDSGLEAGDSAVLRRTARVVS